MIRKLFKEPFSLRLIFEDADRIPVNMRGISMDIWLSTRQGAKTMNAFIRKHSAHLAQCLPDGTVLVKLSEPGLFPGKLKAVINVFAQFDDAQIKDCRHLNHPNLKPDSDQLPGENKEYITLCPDVPIEIVDPGARLSRHDDQPVDVHVRFAVRRPSLTQHVTAVELDNSINSLKNEFNSELDKRLEGLEGVEPAGSQDIEFIKDKFKLI